MPTGIYKRTPEMKTGRYRHFPNQGFQKGHKGFVEKGEFHHSEETKINLSESHKGQHSSPKTEFKNGEHLREKHPRWKGGRIVDKNGYVRILIPNHPFCNKKSHVFEHRLIMEKHIGRYLTPEEVVHHNGILYPINSIKNRSDNRIENLRLFSNNNAHRAYHKHLI